MTDERILEIIHDHWHELSHGGMEGVMRLLCVEARREVLGEVGKRLEEMRNKEPYERENDAFQNAISGCVALVEAMKEGKCETNT